MNTTYFNQFLVVLHLQSRPLVDPCCVLHLHRHPLCSSSIIVEHQLFNIITMLYLSSECHHVYTSHPQNAIWISHTNVQYVTTWISHIYSMSQCGMSFHQRSPISTEIKLNPNMTQILLWQRYNHTVPVENACQFYSSSACYIYIS